MTDSLSQLTATPIVDMPEPDWPVLSRIPIQGSDEPFREAGEVVGRHVRTRKQEHFVV